MMVLMMMIILSFAQHGGDDFIKTNGTVNDCASKAQSMMISTALKTQVLEVRELEL